MPYTIEIRNRDGEAILTEAFNGGEMDARQRAAALTQEMRAASGHVFDAQNQREVYQIAERF